MPERCFYLSQWRFSWTRLASCQTLSTICNGNHGYKCENMPHNFSIAKYLNVICKPGERALLEIRQEMSERGNDTLFGGAVELGWWWWWWMCSPLEKPMKILHWPWWSPLVYLLRLYVQMMHTDVFTQAVQHVDAVGCSATAITAASSWFLNVFSRARSQTETERAREVKRTTQTIKDKRCTIYTVLLFLWFHHTNLTSRCLSFHKWASR